LFFFPNHFFRNYLCIKLIVNLFGMIKRIFQNFVLITFLMNSIFCFSLYGQYSKEISEPINQAGFNESAPFISLDGKHFVFVSDKDGKLLFYESTLDDDGRWGVPVPLSEINSYGGPNSVIAAPCYNYDASILYFEANYKFDSAGVDIYYSKRTSNGWSEPKSIGAPINTKAYDGQPSISSDNKTLYFVRQNLTTEIEDYKCYIIFSAELGRNAKWETPVALPMPINLECEMSPRISADNKTLYFSSFREGGKGDFDLFFAKKIAKSVWAVPNPIDTVNSIYADNYPTITGAGDLLFYNVSRTEKK